MEVDVTLLKEGKEGVDFLVERNVFYEGDEGIPHGHVMGICFMNEANWRLGVYGVIWSGGKVRVLEGCIKKGISSGVGGIDAGYKLDIWESCVGVRQ